VPVFRGLLSNPKCRAGPTRSGLTSGREQILPAVASRDGSEGGTEAVRTIEYELVW